MPSPGRGIAVLQTAEFVTINDDYVRVEMHGDTYDLPWCEAFGNDANFDGFPSEGATVWVLWDGRTGLVLGWANNYDPPT